MLKSKIVLALAILLISSIGGSWILFGMYRSEKKERQRTEFNQNALLKKEQEKFKITINGKDSLYAVAVNELTLSKKEIKESRDSLLNVIDALGLKLRRVQSIIKTETTVSTTFDAPIVDTPIISDTPYGLKVDTIKCIDWSDSFNSFSACIDGDTLRNANMTTIVPITQVADRIPKFEFWFLRLGTKGIRQQMFSENPNAEIKYAEVITLK